jgi:hypothetical protein
MLKLHDQVIKINEIDTINLDDNQFCNMLEYMNNKNTSKKITFKRGNKQFDYIMN